MTLKSLVDSSSIRLQTARRYREETDAGRKLEILEQLRRRYIDCRLDREGETRVEQSFNEQLFVDLLGYRPLFSREPLPYHLRPKNFARACRRFDDFSLGEFWGADDDDERAIVTAEFKPPGTDLLAPQPSREDKATPVEQAFGAAAGFPNCRWVIVSNFRELRLYHHTDAVRPLLLADLHQIRSRKQLALLGAHLDFDALIKRKADMIVALDPSHPSAPLSAEKGAFRFIATFTHRANLDRSLCDLYDAAREVILERLKEDHGGKGTMPVDIEDGWCCAETQTARVAISAEGQVRYSCRRSRSSHSAASNPDAGFIWIAHEVHDFLQLVERLFKKVAPSISVEGRMNAELREIRGWRINFETPDLFKGEETNSGVSVQDEILSGDFKWGTHGERQLKDIARTSKETALVAADCVGELAIQFRSPDGSRVRFDHAALAKRLEARK